MWKFIKNLKLINNNKSKKNATKAQNHQNSQKGLISNFGGILCFGVLVA
jgi:hypothetical protein